MKYWRVTFDPPLSGEGYLVRSDDRPEPVGLFDADGNAAPESACYTTVEIDADAPPWFENIPAEGPPPLVFEAVPDTVSAMRFRLALKNAGLYATVQAAMEAENGAAEIMWEYAVEFHRFNAELVRMAEKMGVTDEQLDNIFRTAAALSL